MQSASAPSPTRVLIIDDNPIDIDLFKRLLHAHSARSLQYDGEEHGRAGLQRYREQRPDCVLLDLNLPDIDGIELLESLLREPHSCPVIVTTAYGTEEIAVQAMKSGAADYLIKGAMTGEGLSHVLENAMQKWALTEKVKQQRLAIEQRSRELELALERERAARFAVEQSENRYRTLAEAMPQVVWTALHPSGDFDYLNERWSYLTGAPSEQALGKCWLDFIPGDERNAARDAWQAARDTLQPLEVQCRFRVADGGHRWQLMRALPLMQNDVPVKWLGTFTDIEDQKRAGQMLHQRQKLESIGILAGGVAHDFNNLLVGIVGGVSYSLDTLPASHELRPILEGALKAGERAAQLTRQMLAYAGKGSFLVESVDLSQVLQTTGELLQASIPKTVDLKLLTRPDLPRIQADSSQLQQIVMNLIINAAEAIPAGRHGFIIVRTDVQHIDGAHPAGTAILKPGDYVTLDVRDNGSGIAPAVLEKIFDPFFTTKFTGRGLGLAAVHGIIRANNGGIEVETEVGKGTTFRVFLPASGEPAGPVAAQPQGAKCPTAHGTILIVDDEPIVRSTGQLSLRQAGHNVETASSGQEALHLLAASGGRFSLVVLDLNMPGLTGEETFDAIRTLYADLPVVICSGYSESEIRLKFAGKKVTGFIQKPFQSRLICDKVAQFLNAAPHA